METIEIEADLYFLTRTLSKPLVVINKVYYIDLTCSDIQMSCLWMCCNSITKAASVICHELLEQDPISTNSESCFLFHFA